MNLSLILATVDRTQELDRLLDYIIAQTNRRFELIVVDQNTDDRLVPFVKRAQESGIDIRYFRFDVRNLAAARNQGLVHATHEIVAFPDDDCWYEEDVIERVLQKFSADPSLDGVEACWKESRRACGATSQLSLTAWRRFRGIGASSITLFLRTELVRRLGGFDVRLGVPGWFGSGEEVDLVLRCLANGANVRFMPDVVVHHAFEDGSKPPSGAYCQRARQRARGVGAIFIKHRLSPFVVIRVVFSPFVRALMRPWRVGYVMRNVCVAFGIVEGMVGWVRQARRVACGAPSFKQKK